MTRIKNKFGRKGGRGIRPWLLIPKVLAVGCVLGGLVAMGVIACAQIDQTGAVLGLILSRVVAPGVAVAMLCGVGLFRQHAVVFWRMRWLRVKFGVLMVLLMDLAFLWESVAGHADEAPSEVGGGEALRAIRWSVAVAIALVVTLVVLGRYKPRFGMGVMKIKPKRLSKEEPV
jgi:hypothetical protein